MNIAVDMDSITVDIMEGLNAYHNKTYNTTYKIHNYTDFNLSKIWRCSPQEAMKRVYDFYNSEYMDQLLPMPGAIEGINELADKYKIIFITSRPHFTDKKTNMWMTKYFPYSKFRVYFTNQFTPEGQLKFKKSELCKKLDIYIIIDDAPENVLDCASNEILTLLYTHPWNITLKENNYIIRVNDWPAVVEKVHTYASNE